VQVDVGIGDAITPGPERINYPRLLDDLPAPVLHAYPVYTVLAEKFEAIVRLDLDNTRMKDFFDIWMLSEEFEARRRHPRPRDSSNVPAPQDAHPFRTADRAHESLLRRQSQGPTVAGILEED